MKTKNLTIITALTALLLPVNAQADDTADVPYRPLLEEGKTWWYTHLENDFACGHWGYFGNNVPYEFTIEGDTIIDGKEYKRFYSVSSGKGGRFEKNDKICVDLLREEDRRIYSFYNGLIYDFNLASGDPIPPAGNSGGLEECLLERRIESQATGDFVMWGVVDTYWDPATSLYWIIEGVGTTTGFLHEPNSLVKTGYHNPYPPQLRWVTDKDGNVIYRESGVTKPWEIAGVEYRPLVEEGKIWWYEAAVTDLETGKIRKGSFGTTLAGDTVVNGKSYKKYIMLPESRGGNPGLFIKDINVPLALAREDENRFQYFITRPFVSNTILPIDNKAADDPCYDATTGEYQVYQFALYPSYYHRSRFEGEPYYEGASRRVIERDGKKFVQRYNGTINVDPMEHNDYWPEDNGRNYSTEGIGWPKGLLCCPAVGRPSDKEIPEAPVLTYVTDTENNVIFEVAGREKPWEHIGEHLRTVREDRVWNYKEFSLSPDIYNIEDLNGYHFKGTKIIGEKVYFIFRDGEGKELACLRQEGSKVFLYTADSPAFISPNSSVPDDKEGRETADEHLLYDFSLEPGDTFTSLCFFSRFNGPHAEPREYRVVDVYELESHGNKYRCLEITDADRTEDYLHYKIIEGIGSEKGILPFPQYDYVTSSQRYQLPIINTVVNEYGDEIYSNPDCNPYPGEAVEGIGISSLSLGYDGRAVTAQSEGDVEMTVMSLEGVTVLTCSGNGTAAADVCALMPGVYVAEARCGNAVKRMKFIVK